MKCDALVVNGEHMPSDYGLRYEEEAQPLRIAESMGPQRVLRPRIYRLYLTQEAPNGEWVNLRLIAPTERVVVRVGDRQYIFHDKHERALRVPTDLIADKAELELWLLRELPDLRTDLLALFYAD